MQKFVTIRVCVVSAALRSSPASAHAQGGLEEPLSGPNSHETAQGPHGHLFGKRVAPHIGQFAGQDFCGAQHYAASFILEPMGYGLGNFFTDVELFDPPSTPAMEVGVTRLRTYV